jgi:hypothetical protein
MQHNEEENVIEEELQMMQHNSILYKEYNILCQEYPIQKSNLQGIKCHLQQLWNLRK